MARSKPGVVNPSPVEKRKKTTLTAKNRKNLCDFRNRTSQKKFDFH